MFSFSKPRLISIGLLLAILLISLMIPSYIEGLENKQVAEIIEKVNENAPKSNDKSNVVTASTVATGNTVATGSNGITGSTNKPTGIALGKPLTVNDITGALQNNPGVQKMLNKPL